jgi:hypothetical protein
LAARLFAAVFLSGLFLSYWNLAIDPYDSIHFVAESFLAKRLDGGVALLYVRMVVPASSARAKCAFNGGARVEDRFR